MDPNNNLKDLRANVQTALAMVYSDDKPKPAKALNLLLEIAEDFDNLDDWLRKGGFLPTDWSVTK